jgi:tetratricopeptide (TPR) repeat protein
VAAAESAEQLLQRGIEHYDNGEFEDSVRVLKQAEAAASDPTLLGRIHLYLGVNYSVLAKIEEARREYAEALKNDRNLRLDPEQFKPEIVTLFLEVKGKPKGRLSVRSTPPGAEVRLDGKLIGTTPLQGVEVEVGEHQVSIELSRHYDQSRPVKIEEDREQSVEVTLAPKPPVLRPGTRPFSAAVAFGGSLSLMGSLEGTTQDYAGNLLEVKGSYPHLTTLLQEFGYHFSGKASGFALGVMLKEAFGSAAEVVNSSWIVTFPEVSCFLFEVGPKLWWDIPLSSKKALYLSPMLVAGYAHLSLTNSATATTEGVRAVTVQPGIEVKLILIDRVMLFVRPFAMDVLILFDKQELAPLISGNVFLRFDVAAGAGVTF